jgi:hypothetical protein
MLGTSVRFYPASFSELRVLSPEDTFQNTCLAIRYSPTGYFGFSYDSSDRMVCEYLGTRVGHNK